MESENESERRITLGKIVAYPVGVLLILAGIANLANGDILAGVLVTIGGAIALPIVRTKLNQERGIALSRWATVVIVLALVIGGGLAISNGGSGTPSGDGADSSGGDGDTNTPGGLIEGPPEALLPTIDDFDADWGSGGSNSPENQTTFYNTQTETTLTFRVTLHDSVSDAEGHYSERKQSVEDDGFGTESVSVGNEGFLYKPGEDVVDITFRERNVVGRVQFLGGNVMTPEQNARNFAELLHEKIVE